jgi:hypothetical protein
MAKAATTKVLLTEEEKAAKKAAKEATKAASKNEQSTIISTQTDCYNGFVTIDDVDGLFVVTQHRKGVTVSADSLDEANNEAAKFLNDTQF